MPLDREQVEHIASLARIGLTNDEIEMFRQQLSDILEQFQVLAELDSAGIEPTGHAVDLRGVLREDEAEASLSPEETLSNAPRREGEFIRVKAVLEE